MVRASGGGGGRKRHSEIAGAADMDFESQAVQVLRGEQGRVHVGALSCVCVRPRFTLYSAAVHESVGQIQN